MEKLKEQVESQINSVIEEGVTPENVDYIYRLIDIHKDIANEEYWKKKEEMYMYRNSGYGNYGRDEYGRGGYGNESYGRRQRDSRGRYKEGGSYGRNYRGEEMLDEMYKGYQGYSEGREEYGRGNYGAKDGTMKSLEYMLQSVTEFLEMLKQDANSQEEMQLIQEYTRHISEM